MQFNATRFIVYTYNCMKNPIIKVEKIPFRLYALLRTKTNSIFAKKMVSIYQPLEMQAHMFE